MRNGCGSSLSSVVTTGRFLWRIPAAVMTFCIQGTPDVFGCWMKALLSCSGFHLEQVKKSPFMRRILVNKSASFPG